MISKFIKLYRKKQLKDMYSLWNKCATIGEMFELGGIGANIANESGDKNCIQIGNHVRISGSLICKTGGKIIIGNYSVIQDQTQIQCLQHIKIGNYVGIASGVTIVDNNHHRIEPEERVKHRIRVAPGSIGYPGLGNGWELAESAAVIINDVVWIGANSVILKGVTIGEGAIVARNSIVTKDIPPYRIVAGNPAKIVKEIEKPEYKYFEV